MLKRESYIIAASLLLSSPFVQFNWAYEDSIFKMCLIPDFDLLILEQIFVLIYQEAHGTHYSPKKQFQAIWQHE